MYRIGEKEIWNPGLFKPVSIVIRPDCKSYNALFIRKYLKIKGQRKLTDRIFIYNKTDDFDPKFLDSLLVHEMIHQYICQNKLKDSSSHGTLFRDFMKKINKAFPEELKINISDRNPNVKYKSDCNKPHTLLIIHFENNISYCCVINPTKIQKFENLLQSTAFNYKISSYCWAHSNDPYFNNFSKCTRTLHGVRKPRHLLLEFCREHDVKELAAESKNSFASKATIM